MNYNNYILTISKDLKVEIKCCKNNKIEVKPSKNNIIYCGNEDYISFLKDLVDECLINSKSTYKSVHKTIELVNRIFSSKSFTKYKDNLMLGECKKNKVLIEQMEMFKKHADFFSYTPVKKV